MTTLFKKLSITTLTLAIASGIVFSVGSSEPSTFEGEASTSGIYTLLLDDEEFNQSNQLTVNKTVDLTATFTISGNGTDRSFPIIKDSPNTTSLNIGFAAESQIQQIRSIKVIATNTTFIQVNFEDTAFGGSNRTPTASGVITLTSNTTYYTLGLGTPQSYPDRFTLTLNGATTPTLTSIEITYDC